MAQSRDAVVRRGAEALLAKAKDVTPELIAHYHRNLGKSNAKAVRKAAAEGLGNAKVDDPSVIADLFAFFDEGGEGAAEALVQIGASAMAGFNDRLMARHKNRILILKALEYERDDHLVAVLPGLIHSLGDSDAKVREEALEVIDNLGHAAVSALPQVREAYKDEDRSVRTDAVHCMGRINPSTEEVFADMVHVLEDPDGFVRHYALEYLSKLDVGNDRKLPYLMDAISDEDWWARAEAANGLARMGSDAVVAVPDLIPLLNDESNRVRSAAISALVGTGADPEEIVPAIAARLEDEDSSVREEAMEALGELGQSASSAVSAILQILITHKDYGVRVDAAKALGEIGNGTAASQAVDELRKLLWTESGYVRASAAQALEAMGKAAQPAEPDLIRAVLDPEWGDVKAETRAKHNFHGIALIPTDLSEMLGEIDQRPRAIGALEELEPTPAILAALVQVASDSDTVVAMAAVEALGRHRPHSDDALRELTTHSNPAIATMAEELQNKKD